MRRSFYSNPYNIPQYSIQNNDQRFIGPIVPFLGGAIIGYIAGRPQYNNNYPTYYPVYYPYYQYPTYSSTTYPNN